MSRLRDERGFTLVELVLTMSLLLVVLGAITALFVSGSRAQTDLQSRFQAQDELRVALDALRLQIHSACAVADGTPVATPLSSVTIWLPPNCDATSQTTWCTRGSGTRYGLYQVPGSATCTGGTRKADHLTSANVFTYTKQDTPAGSYTLPRLSVDLPLNVRGSGPGTYALDDEIVFRNGFRCVPVVDAPDC